MIVFTIDIHSISDFIYHNQYIYHRYVPLFMDMHSEVTQRSPNSQGAGGPGSHVLLRGEAEDPGRPGPWFTYYI